MEEEYTSLHLAVAGQTHLGQRSLNEDAWWVAQEPDTASLWAQRGRLFVVADGMGGHAAGEIASQLAIETLKQEYYSSNDVPLPPSLRLKQAIQVANHRVYEQSAAHEAQAGMGTTLVAAVVRDDWLTIANVGDSRAYLVREGKAWQVTHDHSWVAEQMAAGALTEQEAKSHMYRHVVTRCLGHRPSLEVDVFEHMLQPGDTVLICSDGLSNQISSGDMARILSEHAPQEAVDKLVRMAYESGGADNITAVVFRVSSPPGAEERAGLSQEASRVTQPVRIAGGAPQERERTSRPASRRGSETRRSRVWRPAALTALLVTLAVVACVGIAYPTIIRKPGIENRLLPFVEPVIRPFISLVEPLVGPLFSSPLTPPTGPTLTLTPEAAPTATKALPPVTGIPSPAGETTPTATQTPPPTSTPTATDTPADPATLPAATPLPTPTA